MLPVTQVLGDIVASYGVPRERIVVIPNGINAERSATRPTRSRQGALGLDGNMVLGFTGFVRDWHGLDKVIAMIANDPPDSSRHLLVVGDGPARAALEAQAETLGIAHRVQFTGIIERDDVARYVAAFDIALQPAVVAYASPLKLFEYLALGKAIVGPAQPNIEEILTARPQCGAVRSGRRRLAGAVEPPVRRRRPARQGGGENASADHCRQTADLARERARAWSTCSKA